MDAKKLIGKKLLILGCTQDDCQIVETAKAMGVYTIVSDNHLDWTLAPAKLIADEAWNISWADIPALKNKAEETGVNGVMAGYDERRVRFAIQLSKALGTPFYAEDEDVLLKTFNKLQFKEICMENGVPVPKEYYKRGISFDDWAQDVEYPVLVKPVDNGGSAGIRTCYNKEELRQNIQYALSFSQMEDLVVEKLIKKAQEVVIYYSFADGEVALSAMCDKYERVVSEGFNSLPDVYLYPSCRLREYMERHNDNVIRMLKNLGMREGSANLQGFYTESGEFVFFEMDFRPGGTNTYHFTDYFSGENYLKMMINYSLTGSSDKDELKKADPLFQGKLGCIFTLNSKNGVISRQEGKTEVDKLPNIIHSCFYHPIGKKIAVNGSQVPKTFRAYIVGDTIEEIRSTIRTIQSCVHVYDQNGENMLFEPFDVMRLKTAQDRPKSAAGSRYGEKRP